MSNRISGTLFASALLLSLAVSARAAEEKQAPPAKAEKMGEVEKKPAMTAGTEQTRKVQEALKAKNYDPGPFDGRMGPKTRGALKDFQNASGLKMTGQLDSQTAEKLGIEKTAAPTRAEKKDTKSKEPTSQEKK
jgi:peptidoglycan hydrolase-like protein with peptidoglycan-binding domain